MSTKQHLIIKLQQKFNLSYLEVINESHNHAGSATSSHFKIIVVSDDFDDKTLLQRHRAINNLFKDELQYIHALSIHTYTATEWQQKKSAPTSPQCAGKNK